MSDELPRYPSISTQVSRPALEASTEPSPLDPGFVTVDDQFATIKSAKRMVESGKPEAMKAVEAVSAGYPLLLCCEANVVSRTAVPWDAPAIAVDAETERKLAGRVVVVHVPITTQGALEVAQVADAPGARAAQGGEGVAGGDGALAREAAPTALRKVVGDGVAGGPLPSWPLYLGRFLTR